MSSSSSDITTMASAVQSVPQLIAMLQSATPTEAADILAILDRGLPLWTERREAADAAKPLEAKKAPVEPAAPKKAAAPKAAAPKVAKVAPMALPEAAEGAPDASEYRLPADSWDADACIARITKGGEDKRWKPIIFRESACGGKVVEGSDLCAKCCKREEKYAADPKPGDWCGRLTEEPLDWQHMLGTSWADEKKPKFLGLSAVASVAGSVADEVASENGSAEEMPAPAKKPDAAAKEAAAAAKAAEKEAAAAAKAAEKEAAAAAKAAAAAAAKAAKEAEKAAAKEEKAAAAAAAKAAKGAKAKATDAVAVKAVKAAAKPKAKAAVAAVPVEVEGELKLIEGTLYMVKKGNVFEYDELTEVAGDFVGRLTADETIDTEAEEVTTVESDTD